MTPCSVDSTRICNYPHSCCMKKAEQHVHSWDCKSDMNEEGNYVTVCTCGCGETYTTVLTKLGEEEEY